MVWQSVLLLPCPHLAGQPRSRVVEKASKGAAPPRRAAADDDGAMVAVEETHDTHEEVQCRFCHLFFDKQDCAKQGSKRSPSYLCKGCRNAESQLWRVTTTQGDEVSLQQYLFEHCQ